MTVWMVYVVIHERLSSLLWFSWLSSWLCVDFNGHIRAINFWPDDAAMGCQKNEGFKTTTTTTTTTTATTTTMITTTTTTTKRLRTSMGMSVLLKKKNNREFFCSKREREK